MQISHTSEGEKFVAPRAPLEFWLFNRRISISAFAKEIGVSQPRLSKALMSPDNPNFCEASPKMRRKVRLLTEGAIGTDDWPEPDTELRSGMAPETGLPAGSPPAGGATSPLRADARGTQPPADFSHAHSKRAGL